jgi:nucleotide-binding universal stress UspA family protein
MKTFLVPTDFSEASKNAIEYAVEMAKATGTKIILFHAYHVPPTAIDATIVIPSPAELEEGNRKRLQDLRSEIYTRQENTVLTIECICEYGFAVDEIIRYAQKSEADLIIMGMQGAGWMAEKIFGSITTAVIRQCPVPVLSVGKEQRFHNPEKIVLAYDYKPVRTGILNPLLALTERFASKLFILNVSPDREQTKEHISDTFKNVQLDSIFEDTAHTFHYRTNEDLIEAIDRFAKMQQAQLVVMIPREHAFWQKLFKEPATKRAAFHLSVPVLSIPE